MLSKTSIVILGMLLKGDKNAYDMLKMIDLMNMKYWFPIGATTLYETCIRLEKKGFIENTGESDAKAIYRITEKGKDELKSTICSLFERIDYDTVWFCLAVTYSDVLTKKELALEKKKRAALLEEYENGTKENKEKMLLGKASHAQLCAIDRMIRVIELEKATLSNL